MSNETTNPKELWKEGKKYGYVSAIADVWSPIAEEIRDPETLKYVVSGAYKYVPFLEGGDASFAFFSRMRRLSPTQGAVIKSIGEYSFGGGLTVIRKSDGFADIEEQPVQDQERQSFKNWLETWTNGIDILKSIRETYQSFKTYGNAYLEIVKTTVTGQTFFQYKAHSADRVRYMQSQKNDPNSILKFVWLSPEFTYTFLSKYPPDLVPVYPFWSDEDNNTQRTIIHLKNTIIERDWYGEPDSISSLFNQYSEYQRGRYFVDSYANDFVGKIFIETETDDSDEAKQMNKAFDKAIVNCFTNKGASKKSVLHRARPIGTEPTKLQQIAPNTNEKFHQTMASVDENQIIKSHDWHPILFMKVAGSMGGSQEFREIFKVKNVSVIQPMQNTILDPYRMMIGIVANETGFDLNRLTIGALTPYQQLLEEESNQENNKANG